jgi:hypothetical protein
LPQCADAFQIKNSFGQLTSRRLLEEEDFLGIDSIGTGIPGLNALT